MKVFLNKEKCVDCGSCETTCPAVFDTGEDMRIHIKEPDQKSEQMETKEIADAGCVEEAVDICPVQAIRTE